MSMTPREITIAKLTASAEGAHVPFEPLEAKLAGIFTEDALTLEDIFDDNEEEVD